MNMKRIIAMILCLCLALSLVACGGSSAPAEKPAEKPAENKPAEAGDAKLSGDLEVGILLAEGTTGYLLLEDAVKNHLEEANPDLEISFTFANTKARSFMEQKWRSETEAPDTDFMVYNARVASTYEFTDKLLNLAPYLEQEGWSKYKDSAYSVMQMEDGGIYGLVTDTHVQGLYYNKAYFDQFNITPPTTWDELLAACATLVADTRAMISDVDAAAKTEFQPQSDSNVEDGEKTVTVSKVWNDAGADHSNDRHDLSVVKVLGVCAHDDVDRGVIFFMIHVKCQDLVGNLLDVQHPVSWTLEHLVPPFRPP